MREDKQEELEKIFTKGCLCIHKQPNGNYAYFYFNPEEDEFLEGCKASLDESLEEES